MRTLKIIGLTAALIATLSCSKKEDEDTGPDLSQLKVSITADGEVFSVPPGMGAKGDSFAKMVTNDISFIKNYIDEVSSFLQPPIGSLQRSGSWIRAANQNNSEHKSYVLYSGTDSNGEVAYQITDTGSKYTFEYLIHNYAVNSIDWYDYCYAEETKDRSGKIGFMDISSDNLGLTSWVSWSHDSDFLKVSFQQINDPNRIDISLHTKSRTGEETRFYNGAATFKLTWTALGTGTWIAFENGVVSDTGTW